MFLLRLAVLLFQIENVARLKFVTLVEVIVLAEFLLADVELLGNGFPRITRTHHHIEQAVGYVRLVRIRIFLHPFQTSFLVIFVQVIKLDDINQALGISRVGGISGFLQAPCPAFIVGDFQLEERSVTRTTCQKLGVIFIRLLGMLVGSETFATGIVVVTDGLSLPIASALDSEMVVRLAGKRALPCPRLQQALCQSNAGRDMVLLHLIDRQVAILLDVVFVLLVAGLCLK